jgi:spore coat polysaccharide biosynthesis predicted glycosyltransferase SpsG
MKNNWLFIVSTSDSVGRGHLNRCLALASEISTKCNIEFYSNENVKHSKEIIKKNKNIKFFSSGLSKIRRNKYQGVLIDIKKNDKKLFKKFSKIKKSAIISDTDIKISNIKTIISPSLEKRNMIEKDQSALLGRKYYLISKKYKKHKKKINKKVKNILMNFGYLDSKHFAFKVLEILNLTKYDEKVTVLIGKNFPLLKKINKKKYNFRLNVHSGLTDLRYFYKKADLCIGAGGSGMLERFLYGIPSITISTSNDQNYAILNAKKMGATLTLKQNDKKKFNFKLKKILNRIMKNNKKRKILSKKALNYIDTKGASRVAKFLLEKS